MHEEMPAWLIRQEHGVLSEARTRAFLTERFWVLERSVDVEGADFIVQRRLTDRSLLDRDAPRLGFVQAKFFSTSATTQYVHQEYVVDREGKPREEFFLVCHTGLEDQARVFLLAANEITENFDRTTATHSKPRRFCLPGTQVIAQRFEVLDRTSALNKIDRALHRADFYKNRSFLFWALPRASQEKPPIDEIYQEPIDQSWGDIPTSFDKLREAARRARYDVQEVLDLLEKVEFSGDPEAALEAAEELHSYWGDHVSIRGGMLFDEDFQAAVLYHKTRHAQLSDAGLVAAFSAMRRQALEFLTKDLGERMPLGKNDVYLATITYDPDTLLRVQFQANLQTVQELWPEPQEDVFGDKKDIPNTHGVISAEPGEIMLYIVAGRYAYVELKNREFVETTGPWVERISTVVRHVMSDFSQAVLTTRFGDLQSP